MKKIPPALSPETKLAHRLMDGDPVLEASALMLSTRSSPKNQFDRAYPVYAI